MRRACGICVLTISLLLSGCGRAKDAGPVEQALDIRQAYLAAEGCDAVMEVTADYGRRVHRFTAEVMVRGKETRLTVTKPEEVAGISARLNGRESALTFDGVILDTGTLDDEGLTVLGALPALLEAAKSGFIDSCGVEQLGQTDALRVLCRDPELERGQGREITLWFDRQSRALCRGEMAVDGVRVIDCTLERFVLC